MATLLPAVLFYALGHSISTTAWMRKVAAYKWSAVLFSLVLTVTLAPTNSGCMLDYEGRCNNNDSLFAVSIASGQFGFVPVCAASAVAGIVLILSLSYALAAKESRVSLFFTRMGRFSLQILLVNGFVLVFLQPWLMDLLSDWRFSKLIVLAPLTLAILQVAMLPITVRLMSPLILGAKKFGESLTGRLPRRNAKR